MSELNRYQILFIEDNIGKKSVKKIAQHLGVDKKAVEDHIKRSKASPAAARRELSILGGGDGE